MNVKPPLSRRPRRPASTLWLSSHKSGVSSLFLLALAWRKWDLSTSLENECRKSREKGGSFRVVGRWLQGVTIFS